VPEPEPDPTDPPPVSAEGSTGVLGAVSGTGPPTEESPPPADPPPIGAPAAARGPTEPEPDRSEPA
jgi:hypothetical protein